ncbi:MAG: threonyl-tRNA synthetase editing domain-containing protein [bacterium]
MKLLMIFCDKFGYRTSRKGLDTAPSIDESRTIGDALVGFIHVERQDESDPGYVETKLVKNLKWAARKNDSQRVVLHSFTHLADGKASPETTKDILDRTQARLVKAGYEVCQTPFGYFLDLHIEAPGSPLTRLFKDICPSAEADLQ